MQGIPEVVWLAEVITAEQVEALRRLAYILQRRRKDRETNQRKAAFLLDLVRQVDGVRKRDDHY